MKKALIFLLLFCITNAKAQVNPQNGSANYSLPIFNWNDNFSRLNNSISVNYNSGNGLRVNDVSSNIGQGWNLATGGVISRIQVGEPDDQKPYFQGSSESWQDTKKYPAGYLYNTHDISLGVSSSINQYPIFKAKNTIYKQHNEVAADTEMDRFAFQFNGRSGIFILEKNGNTGVCLENSRIRIWFVRNESNASQNQIRTTITGFYIMDENGLVYKFTKYAKTKILKSNFCNPEQTRTITQPNFKNNKVYYETSNEDGQIVHPYIINEWHLEEVEDLLTHRKINLTYAIRNINAPSGSAISHYESPSAGPIQFRKTYTIISYSKTISESMDLAGITYPDGHQIILNYDKVRQDLNGAYALGSVDVKFQNRYISKYEFNTSYFIGNRKGYPTSTEQKSLARLCLQSIKKYGVDLKESEQPYQFEYYMGSSIPGDMVPAPFTHLKDIWGFYNADNSKAFDNSSIPLTKSIDKLSNFQLRGLCFSKDGQTGIVLNPKLNYARNGLLKQIQYPSGGSIKYEYSQNEAVLPGQSVNSYVGGVHVSKTSVTDGGYSNDCNNPLVTNYNYKRVGGSNLSSLWGLEIPVNSLSTSSYYSPKSKYFYYKPVLDVGCKYRFLYPGILAQEQATSLTTGQLNMQAFSSIMGVVSAVMQVKDIVNVFIGSPGAVLAIVIDVICSVINLAITCLGDMSKTSSTTTYYNSDINSSNPLPAMYKAVEIIEGDGSNGKTVMEFTSDDEYPIWSPTNPSFSMKQRYATWAYGLNKSTTLYDANNFIVKKIENKYKRIKLEICLHCGTYPFVNCKAFVSYNESKRSDDWLLNANYKYPDTYTTQSIANKLQIGIDSLIPGISLLDSTIEKVYKQGSNSDYLKTITEYGYDYSYGIFGNTYILNRTSTYTPDGVAMHKVITYQSFYANNLMLPNSVTLSKGTGPYETNAGNVINRTYTQYFTHSNGDIKPSQISEQRFTVPGQYPEPVDKVVQNFTYDALGNLIGQKDEGLRNISKIYDYDDRLVVATIINADAAIDKYAYSSFETTKLGGWVLSGGAAVYNNNNVTGARSMSLTTGKSLTSVLNTAKPATLSFWSSAVLTVSSGATLVKNEPTINGFTFYEYKINTGTSSISISGNGNIDELRLLPQNARMQTVTYDPIIGKTSEADENNRISYYEYDNLGRLRFIKDDYKNTIKMYEYNMAKTPVCPVNYSNFTVSEIFTKSNCASGYVGSEVVFTIPAGTYNSTISQANVDAMVENDLLNNGQNYANTNGTCIPKYGNIVKSGVFTKEDCEIGYTGTSITYTVPANTYFSTISQADANEQAQDELDANGQAFANFPGNASCVIDYTAVWEGTGSEDCYNGHKRVEVKDMNPNSSTYNTTQWIDTGVDPSCPSTACTLYKVTIPTGSISLNNLYIEHYDCYNSVTVIKSWDEFDYDSYEDPEGNLVTHICSNSAPRFRYGLYGNVVSIPGIIIEEEGACPQ